MTSQTIDRRGNRHAGDTGRFAGHIQHEAQPSLLDPEPVTLVETDKPLNVKPGRQLVADIGRGLEEFTVLSPSEVNGTRFVQDRGNQTWELTFKDGRCQVVADPQLLARRTRIVVEGHNVGIARRIDFARGKTDAAGLTETATLHLKTCPHLDEPSTTGFPHTIWDRVYQEAPDHLVTLAVKQHRADPGSLCECLR